METTQEPLLEDLPEEKEEETAARSFNALWSRGVAFYFAYNACVISALCADSWPPNFVWVLSCITWMLYLYMVLGDPGYVATFNHVGQDTAMNLPCGRYCNTCDLWQPIRSKHCNSCSKCVAKYDHHSIWLGSCVGERNHFMFWIYLMAQSTLCIAVIALLCGRIQVYGDDSYTSAWEYFLWAVSQNWAEGLALFALGLCTWLPVLLAVYHTYLIATNQTTWEFSRKQRITYLRMATHDRPFDEGICTNFYLAWCASHSPHLREWHLEWKVPEQLELVES